MSRPMLVIIAGPPGAGKSRLAGPLAKALELPLYEKDRIKERLADEFGEGALEHSKRFGGEAFIELYASAGTMLEAGQGCVIEAFFHPGVAENELAPLIERSDAVLVHVTADEPLLIDRFKTRMESPDRHPIHNDTFRLEEFRAALAAGRGKPLDVDIPRLVVDTTYGSLDPAEMAFMIREMIYGEEE